MFEVHADAATLGLFESGCVQYGSQARAARVFGGDAIGEQSAEHTDYAVRLSDPFRSRPAASASSPRRTNDGSRRG